ncbi:hypothetical protein L7F22_013168 [Adiantum nelumboides]|nr:hypothetical protein [Adiantum nelumboides]
MRAWNPSKIGCSPAGALLLAILACSVFILLTILTLPRAPSPMEETTYSKRRTALYQSMATDLEEHGARFLDAGSTSQRLSLSDIFNLKDGSVEPILKPADPAVRAVVLYLEPQYANPISDVVKKIVAPVFPKEVWYQDSNLYHFSMFHASHHLAPVSATPSEVDEEAHIVESVAQRLCELSIVLDRVVLTSTGVLLGCWQVLNGTDPAVVRKELRNHLPRAPVKQLYNEVMLHTSFARLLGPPVTVDARKSLHGVFQNLLSQLNMELRDYKAVIKEMWFVEELDVLALALKGRIRERKLRLQCDRG